MNSHFLTVQTRSSRSPAYRKANLLRSASLSALLCLSSASLIVSAHAQVIDLNGNPLMKPGNIAVTGFSGTVFPQGGFKPGVNPLDETFIDLDGKSLRIFNIKEAGDAPKGQLINTPPPFEVEARKIGQVFGLAYDNGTLIEGRTDGKRTVANLYATACNHAWTCRWSLPIMMQMAALSALKLVNPAPVSWMASTVLNLVVAPAAS